MQHITEDSAGLWIYCTQEADEQSVDLQSFSLVLESSTSWLDLQEGETLEHKAFSPRSATPGEFELHVTLEHTGVLVSKADDESPGLSAVISVVAPATQLTRTPVALVAVIDRSASMRGEPLKMTLKTLRFLLTQLREVDSFGLVSYSAEARVDMPLTPCDDAGKHRIEVALQWLIADGGTNLSGGLLRGIGLHHEDQSAKSMGEDIGEKVVRSVFLLTDGHANRGITDAGDLAAAAQATLRELGPYQSASIHCFGYGDNHNAAMLRSVAETGRGSYFYVQNEEMIATQFADALGGLLSMVIQRASLRLVCPTISLQTGLPFSSGPDGVYTVELGDLLAEERRDVLVDFHPLSAEGEECAIGADMSLCEVSVRGFSLLSKSWQQKGPVEVCAKVVADDEERSVGNPFVARHRNRFIATQAMEAALRAADRGHLRTARNHITLALRKIKDTIPFHSGDVLTSQLVAQLRECRLSMLDAHDYSTVGSKTLTSCTMEHTIQSHGWYMNSDQTDLQTQSLRFMAA